MSATTTTYLSNPDVLINSTISLRDQCSAATLTRTVEALESTAFGDLARFYVGGLESNELTLTLYMSYAANETYATLSSLVGTQFDVIVSPAAPASAGTYTTTNPGFKLEDCYLASLPVINATMGELSTIDITIQGGLYSVDVS
jgi:hypothetical protein